MSRRTIALFGFAFCLYAVIGQGIISVDNSLEIGRTHLQAVIRYVSFLTILTNLAMAFVFLAAVVKGQTWLKTFRKPVTRATVASLITLVAFYYHLVLAADNELAGLEKLHDILLHTINPAVYLIWVVTLNRTGTLNFSKAFVMLVPPLIYLAYVLLRGEITADYPYEIVNARDNGYLAVAKGASMIGVGLFLLNILYISIDRSILMSRHLHP